MDKIFGKYRRTKKLVPFGGMVLMLHPTGRADYLHREAQFLLNKWSQENHGVDFETLTADEKASMESRF